MNNIKRLNSEKKINNSLFKIKIGTINKNHPNVVYFEGSTFISPLFESNDYNESIESIKKAFSKHLLSALSKNDIFLPKHIIDFDVRHKGVKSGKKSFLSFQCHFKQKGNISTLSGIVDKSKDFIDNIISSLNEIILSNDFMISKTKKSTIY